MAIVHLMQATNMSLLPASLPGSVVYDPPSGSSETRLATYDQGTATVSDDIRLGLYGSSAGLSDINVSALYLDLSDADPFPNLFVDGVTLSLKGGQPPLKTGDILTLFRTALAEADTVTGSQGGDTIDAFGGNDTIDGRGGADRIVGGAGNDSLFGGADADVLFGSAGNDFLFGQAGNDDLRGGPGDDVYNGGAGRDILRGDEGADRFDFDDASESGAAPAKRDIIMGFNRSQGDRIDLSTIDANTRGTAPNNQAFEFIGIAAFTGNADDPQARGEIRFVDSGQDIRIIGDINGNRVPDFEILVTGIAELSSSDFIL